MLDPTGLLGVMNIQCGDVERHGHIGIVRQVDHYGVRGRKACKAVDVIVCFAKVLDVLRPDIALGTAG